MSDIFQKDIFTTIERQRGGEFSLNGLKAPVNKDLYFLSKWDELFERYASARLFLRKSLGDDWSYWFVPHENEEIQFAMENKFRSDLFESALISYNIIVDLSWTITYVSAEYVHYNLDSNGNQVNASSLNGLVSLEEAYTLLRKTENAVVTPTAPNNPFLYLKNMAPEFSEAIDLIIEFWKNFSQSSIRSLYNYLKHKGKPIYKEVDSLNKGRLFSLVINNQQYPSDIRDVQRKLVLMDEIDALISFDNTDLFPYIENLLSLLNKAVDPSPIIC
ncbi:hypothetical protein M2145_001028 [Lachnospiraceae bacterium PF1-21]|uniref:hypothetical protein n=1 Tax=Ohessyouella blattaphilus TaxID=2949333 RepID=UPI003E195CE2